ncbi:hypothetical protein LshimejAT787_0309510 [Lyophyllum shimeji]|uniref:Myb/SANT-like domain-containing protein n=1 Tax=Lyophyllum shimeji TaxID=47721 RepID=A0A9P3PJM3_LYOSH|nr:hypothetical protein LshimejAT787_0309510 [Lyophyllum shimeji]
MAAAWTTKNETIFLDFLITQAAAAGDGGNFKMVTFTAASAVVDKACSKGSPKTAKAYQNKWNALRRAFRAIQAIKFSKSGWTWDDEHGANITLDMEDAWNAFIKVYKDAKPFKHKGWVHLEKMTQLMPATVKGTHVFCASQGTSGLDTAEDDVTAQQEDDEDEDEDKDAVVEEDAHPSEGADTVMVTPTPIIPSTPPRSSRRRERAVFETPAPSSKKARVTGAEAISSLTASISRFGDNICMVLAGDLGAPGKGRSKENKFKELLPDARAAVQLAQKEDWLLKSDRLILCNILEKDIKAADAYTALDDDDEEFRQMWIQEKVDEAKASKMAA